MEVIEAENEESQTYKYLRYCRGELAQWVSRYLGKTKVQDLY